MSLQAIATSSPECRGAGGFEPIRPLGACHLYNLAREVLSIPVSAASLPRHCNSAAVIGAISSSATCSTSGQTNPRDNCSMTTAVGVISVYADSPATPMALTLLVLAVALVLKTLSGKMTDRFARGA